MGAEPSFGAWPAPSPDVSESAIDGALMPIGIVRLITGPPSSTIDLQIGHVVTAISSSSIGQYVLQIHTDYQAEDLMWTVGPGDSLAKMVMLFAGDPDQLALFVFDKAGQPTGINRVCIAFWQPLNPSQERKDHGSDTELELATLGTGTAGLGDNRRSNRRRDSPVRWNLRQFLTRRSGSSAGGSDDGDR